MHLSRAIGDDEEEAKTPSLLPDIREKWHGAKGTANSTANSVNGFKDFVESPQNEIVG